MVNTWSPRTSSPTEWEPFHLQVPLFFSFELHHFLLLKVEWLTSVYIANLTCLSVFSKQRFLFILGCYVYVSCLFYFMMRKACLSSVFWRIHTFLLYKIYQYILYCNCPFLESWLLPKSVVSCSIFLMLDMLKPEMTLHMYMHILMYINKDMCM